MARNEKKLKKIAKQNELKQEKVKKQYTSMYNGYTSGDEGGSGRKSSDSKDGKARVRNEDL